MPRIEIINVCFTLMFVFISCKKENTIEPKTEPHSPYTIKYGETLTLPSLDLKIGFREILEDSRCPIGVMCFWQGRARINVWIVTSVTDTITIAPMIYGNSSKEDTIHHIPTDTLGYRITLQQLDPYPVFGDTTHTITDYTALISIIKK
jgi:hypothetical protein